MDIKCEGQSSRSVWAICADITCLYRNSTLINDKTKKMDVCPAKTQISLGSRPVWSESSLCAQWVA